MKIIKEKCLIITLSCSMIRTKLSVAAQTVLAYSILALLVVLVIADLDNIYELYILRTIWIRVAYRVLGDQQRYSDVIYIPGGEKMFGQSRSQSGPGLSINTSSANSLS